MNDSIVWVIIVAFYAPLHYLLPALFLFITGNESEELRKNLIKRALIDSTLSMLLAFVIAIFLVKSGYMIWAMVALFCSMPVPFLRVFTHRSEMSQ